MAMATVFSSKYYLRARISKTIFIANRHLLSTMLPIFFTAIALFVYYCVLFISDYYYYRANSMVKDK